jgi:HSP20 family molecular chaperone IbpA
MRYELNRNEDYGLEPFFKEFFDLPVVDEKYAGRNYMRTDISDEGDHYEMKIDLPSVKKEDVKVSLDDGYLTVTASNNYENSENDKHGKFIRKERFYGSYSRSYYVGDDIDAKAIKAKLDSGVLNITLPKSKEEEKKENQIVVE